MPKKTARAAKAQSHRTNGIDWAAAGAEGSIAHMLSESPGGIEGALARLQAAKAAGREPTIAIGLGEESPDGREQPAAAVTIDRESLTRLLEARARVLFSAAATVRQAESFMEHSSDDGSLDEDQARDVRYVLHGVQKLIEETTGELELAFLEQEAARLTERRAAEEARP